MAWVSKTPDGETIIAETGMPNAPDYARLEVSTDTGAVLRYVGTKPGEAKFARLVKAAREHKRI